MTLPIVILIAALIVLVVAALTRDDAHAKKRPHWYDDDKE